MIIKVKDNPWVGVDERQIINIREGREDAYDLTAADLKRVSKSLRVIQDGRRMEGMGNLVMSIPAHMYFQEALSRPGAWEEEDNATLSRYWDTYDDMRCIKGGNPWRQRRG